MYNKRFVSLTDKLRKMQIEAMLISNFYNILYLTGFKTLTTDEREAFVVVTHNNIYLFTDSRYLDNNYQSTINNLKLKLIEPQKGLLSHLQEIAETENIKTLGFEADDITYYEQMHIAQKLPNLKLIPTDRVILRLREIKDQNEVELVTKACETTDRCLKDIIPLINQGMSEKEIAFKIEFWLKEKGYELAFDPIVAIDKNSAVAHYDTKDGEGKVEKSSVILIDFGVKYKNYLSDSTRMVFYGNQNDRVIKAYNALLQGQEKTIERLDSSHYLREADEYCRKLIIDNRLPNYPHSTGHGVGLEIHEYPKVSFNSDDRKKINQVFTIEPGIYFPGEFGMRLEDTVAIDKDLKPSVLTKFPKKIYRLFR